MNLNASVLWLVCLAIDTIGQLSFKAAATSAHDLDGLGRWKAMFGNFWIWIGIGSYVFEFFAWMAFLSIVPLAQGVLVGSTTILTIMIGGRIFFAEKLSAKRLTAVALIAAGVAFVGWG